MSIFDGVSRPARVAGISLLGVAVVAAVIGTATALSGGDAEETAAPSTTAPAPPGPGAVPGPAPAPQPGAPPAPGPGGPQAAPGQQGPDGDAGSVESGPGGTDESGSGPLAQQGGSGGDQQVRPQRASAAKWVNVRVYNNSTIHGLAARAAQDLRKQGWNVGEAGNYPSGLIPSTTAYYRPGTDEETAGKALASSFDMRAQPRFEGIADSSPGLIVIVTNDYQGPEGKTG